MTWMLCLPNEATGYLDVRCGWCTMNLFGQLYDADDPQRRDRKHNVKLTATGIFIWFILSSLCITLHAVTGAFQGPGAHWSNFLSVLSNSALVGAAFISIGA